MAFFDPPRPPRLERPSRPDMAGAADRSGWRAARFTPQLVVGILVALAGVLLTLDALTIIDASGVRRLFLPLGCMAVGGTLMTHRSRGHQFWGFVLFVFGASMLLNALGLVRVGFWQLFWPLVMILIGAGLIVQTMRRGAPEARDRKTAPHLFAVMGEDKRTITDTPFRGGEMTAIMGGCVMDLRQAVIPPGEEATIDVFGVMCGHEIHVPDGWVVTSRIVPVMAGVDDKRVLPPPVPEGSGPAEGPPRLVLRGMILMGGLAIKKA
jgi:hypothetical protein